MGWNGPRGARSEAEPLHPTVKGAGGDAEELGRLLAPPARLLQGLTHPSWIDPLVSIEAGVGFAVAAGQGHEGGGGRDWTRTFRLFHDLRRQIGDIDRVAFGEEAGALYREVQLAHVARPVVSGHR